MGETLEMEHIYQFLQWFLNYLRLVHITDIIDIGIMAFIIYKPLSPILKGKSR